MKHAKNDMEQEFVTLLNKHQFILHKVCWLFSKGQQSTFEDLRQEVSIAIWHEFSHFRLSRFRHQSKESSWIYSIALYTAIHYNHRHTQSTSLINFVPDLATIEPASFDPSQPSLLLDLLDALPFNDQRWIAYYLDGYNYQTIAQIEGTNEVAARKRMSRIFEKIRQMKENNY